MVYCKGTLDLCWGGGGGRDHTTPATVLAFYFSKQLSLNFYLFIYIEGILHLTKMMNLAVKKR